MAFRLLQGLKNRHLPRKEIAYVFRDKDKVTLLMWYICSLIETLAFCFQSRGSSWIIIHKLWFIWTGKPIQTGCCKLFRNCVFKGFLACLTRRSPPNCYQFQVFSFSKHEKVWAAWNYQWRLRLFFFPFLFLPRQQYFILDLNSFPRSSIHITAGLFKSILYFAISYSKGFKPDSGSLYAFFLWIDHLKSLLFRLKSDCT